MRFLVVTSSKYPVPPEMALGLIDAMSAWTGQWTEAGKMEQVWSFAGLQGGGGILNVDSLEELDTIMNGFPFAPFSDVQVYGITDLAASMENVKETMMQAMQQAG